MPLLLEGKRVLVAGVSNPESLGFSIAKTVQEQGAELILTSFGRMMSITERAAKRLPSRPEILELDVSQPEHFPRLTEQLGQRWDRLDGVVHSLAFAPEACLGGEFLGASWEDVGTAMHVSAYSFAALAEALVPLMKEQGGSVVGLDFDAGRHAMPEYNWMGVAKAALESINCYLARDLGPLRIRVNLVAAGPLRTIASRAIGDFGKFDEVWQQRAPLGWNTKDAEPVGRAVTALLSDWFPATTGEIVHVDGGFHAMGA